MLAVTMSSGLLVSSAASLFASKAFGEITLEDRVGSGGAAAQMGARDRPEFETGCFEQSLHSAADPLAVLQGAGRVEDDSAAL